MKLSPNAWIFWGIVLGALLLRLWQIHYGLPMLLLEDEEFFVGPALHVANGHIDPAWYGAPASVMIYMMAFIWKITTVILNLTTGADLPPSLHYEQSIVLFQVLARLRPAFAGALTAGLAFWIAKDWSRRAGVLAGVMTAGSFFLVEHSHIIRPDILQGLFLLAVCWAWIQILRTPTVMKWYWIGGVAMGLAVSMKYPSAFFAVPALLLMGVLFWRRDWKLRGWVRFVGVSALLLVATMPMLVLNFSDVLQDVVFENRTLHYGHDGLSFFGKLWWYLSATLPWQVGNLLLLVVVLTAAACLWQLLRRRSRSAHQEIAFLVFTAASYIACLSTLSLHWERWLIPTLPLLFLVGAFGLDWILERIRWTWAQVAVLVLVFAGPFARLAITEHAFALPHTEQLADQWIRENIPPTNTVLLAEPYTPKLDASYTRIEVPNFGWETIDDYRAAGVTHLLTSDRVQSVVEEGVSEESKWNVGITVVAQPIYRKLMKRSTLLTEIAPAAGTLEGLVMQNDAAALGSFWRGTNRGPAIRIYRWE